MPAPEVCLGKQLSEIAVARFLYRLEWMPFMSLNQQHQRTKIRTYFTA